MVDLRKKINYFELYDLEDYEFTYETIDNINECLVTSTFKLPQLISRMWATKLLGESPMVAINDKTVNEVFDQDIIGQFYTGVQGIMAIGRVFIVPYLTKDGDYNYDVVIEDRDHVQFYEENGILQELIYMKTEVIMEGGKKRPRTVRFEHYMDNNAYFFKKYIWGDGGNKVFLDDHNGKIPLSKERMLPFKVDLNLSFNDVAKPVWANAYMQIIDVYNTYTHMNAVMERLLPMVAMPAVLQERGRNEARIVGQASKIFTKIPGLNQEWKPEYFGGGYDPEPFIKHLDFVLNNISEHCGFGHRALSYDQDLGVLKTATEVTYSRNDAMINKSLLDNTVNTFIKQLIKSYYYMKEDKWLTDTEIAITNEDSVFNSREEYIKQLQYDVAQNIISKDFYLEEVYPDKEVANIISTNPDLNEFGFNRR